MNHYELLAILSGRFAENEIDGVILRMEDVLKKGSAIIHFRQNLDRKHLAYPIKAQQYGYYILVEFDCTGPDLKKIDRLLALSADILRHCILRKKSVGVPKVFDRKPTLEQEAFGKTAGKSVFGSVADIVESLGEESKAPAPAPVVQQSTPAPAEPAPLEQTPQPQMSAAPSPIAVPIQEKEEKKETKTTPADEPIEEESTASAKKKTAKSQLRGTR